MLEILFMSAQQTDGFFCALY